MCLFSAASRLQALPVTTPFRKFRNLMRRSLFLARTTLRISLAFLERTSDDQVSELPCFLLQQDRHLLLMIILRVCVMEPLIIEMTRLLKLVHLSRWPRCTNAGTYAWFFVASQICHASAYRSQSLIHHELSPHSTSFPRVSIIIITQFC